MKARKWIPFPHDAAPYRYAGPALLRAWPQLHRGDCEPVPAGKHRGELEEAWRAFHAGDFGRAIEAGAALGPEGAAVANKAAGVYATYLAPNNAAATSILEEAVRRAEAAIDAYPDRANSHYFHAFVLGRYSQRISVATALASGLGGKVQRSLERALELEHKHADAHIALGVFHAEVVAKVGALIARLSYGATADAAVREFEAANRLHPQSPVAKLEYAHCLKLLYGAGKADKVTKLLNAAIKCEPHEAMDQLDIEAARAILAR
jgi:tetratricopeptide (TPR) repeat protein